MESLTGKNTGDNLTAAEWNQLPAEVQNVITQLGQALTNTDLNQLGKSIAGYVANSTFYTDSGTADAYVLNKIGTKQVAPAYADGFSARFLPGNTNTGASTVNVAGLGVKSIVDLSGATLAAGSIQTGLYVELFYDLGNDRFVYSNLTPASAIPVGASIMWNLNTPPAGFLEEDGSPVSRTTYADLFAVIGTSYGVGDGSTTFNLPDKRGKFFRGWDNGAGNDPDAASRTNRGDGTTGDNAGTNQGFRVEAHTHNYNSTLSTYSTGPAGGAIIDATRATSSFGGNETRPININVMSCIRFAA